MVIVAWLSASSIFILVSTQKIVQACFVIFQERFFSEDKWVNSVKFLSANTKSINPMLMFPRII